VELPLQSPACLHELHRNNFTFTFSSSDIAKITHATCFLFISMSHNTHCAASAAIMIPTTNSLNVGTNVRFLFDMSQWSEVLGTTWPNITCIGFTLRQ